MPRFHLTFHSRAEGHFNDLRRYVTTLPGSERSSVTVSVDHPDDLRETILNEGQKVFRRVGGQLSVSVGWLSNVEDDVEKRQYYDAISGTEWHWIDHWIKDKVEA